ncbi:MAG: gamma-glutamyl-gamma-aminobutyrate hydrolase family protein, partial [Chloroflexota bacterium]
MTLDATPPRIVVTVAAPARQNDPAFASRKNDLYAGALARHGAEPVLLDATVPAPERERALATMDGLLLSGGADVDPTRYGQPNRGSTSVEP